MNGKEGHGEVERSRGQKVEIHSGFRGEEWVCSGRL
jgi:hypothetical protein